MIYVRITDFNTDMTIDAGKIKNIINDVSCNKSPGLDGLTAEHMNSADSQLLVLLSARVSSILVHGYIPKVVTEPVIVLVIKMTKAITGLYASLT